MTVSVYRINFDVGNYCQLKVDWGRNENSLEVLLFNGKEKKSDWKRRDDVYIYNPRKIKGDFYVWGGGNFVLRKKSYECLKNLFNDKFELLPIGVDHGDDIEECYVVNILNTTNCVNVKKSLFGRGVLATEQKFSFIANKLPKVNLFKIKEDFYFKMFCHQGLVPPEKDFKHLVETNNLKGLTFKKHWSSDD